MNRLELAQKQASLPNFHDKDGRLYLVRCFNCDAKHGRENYGPAVASGQCAWCGWKLERGE